MTYDIGHRKTNGGILSIRYQELGIRKTNGGILSIRYQESGKQTLGFYKISQEI